EKAKKYPALRAGVIYPIHGKIIEAVHASTEAGLIEPVLIGPKEKIKEAAASVNIDISNYEIISIEPAHAAIAKAVAMARQHELGLIIRGGAIRDDLLRVMQKPDKGILTDRCLSYAAL